MVFWAKSTSERRVRACGRADRRGKGARCAACRWRVYTCARYLGAGVAAQGLGLSAHLEPSALIIHAKDIAGYAGHVAQLCSAVVSVRRNTMRRVSTAIPHR